MSTYKKFGMTTTKEQREARHEFWERERKHVRMVNWRWLAFFVYLFAMFFGTIFRGPQLALWMLLAIPVGIAVFWICRWIWHRIQWFRWNTWQ